MRVPINPQTNAPAGQLGYERAVDNTAGFRALSNVVGQYADYAAQEQKKKEMFDVQKMLVDETNNIQQDFDDKVQVQPLGAPNFTQQVDGEYNTRHQQMVKDLKAKGYGEDAVNEFETRLGSIRSQYVARAIDFQEKSSFAKTLDDTDKITTGLAQYTNKNPGAVTSALDELKASLKSSGLDEVEQDKIFQNKKDIILQGAREGFAVQHPEIVLGLYGLPSDLTTTSPANLPAGQEFNLPTYLQKIAPVEGTGKNPKSSAKGHFQFTVGTWLGTYKTVYGNTGESKDQILAKRSDLGVATKVTEKLTNDNIQKLNDAGKPVNDTTVYLSHFLGVQDAIDVLSAHADATVGNLVSSASIAANPTVFKKGKYTTVNDLLSWAQNKMGVDPTQTAGLKPIPKDWRGNQEDAIQELGMTADQAAEFLATGKDTRTVTAPSRAAQAVQEAGIKLDANGQTGLSVLDLSTPTERTQMLTLARSVMNEREATAKAAQRQSHEVWYNEFLNKLQDGKIGQADLDQAYNSGQLTDFDERKKAQAVIDSKIQKNDDLTLFHNMLQSGGKFNPYDDKAQKAVDAGFESAVKFAAQNGGNSFADPFTIALRSWQRTGILPTQGAVMLRGGLVGTDPNQISAAASVASNMLKQNPNAFAGVTGGEEIGKAAAAYTHYVDDLGMSSGDAANKIAQMNSPEFQAKQKANEPQRNAFIDSITGHSQNGKIVGALDIDKAINNAILGPSGWGSTLTFHAFDPTKGSFSEPQRAEARQTYLELALDAYDKFPDAGAAQAYAARQMTRFYGIEGNRLMKYPPTKAYPDIMGSRDYIYDQAKTFVDKSAGFAVPKENVFLQPTSSGSTAAAFRAGKPAPYEIFYTTEVNGQPVLHHIPGKVFVADVDEARRDAAKKAREYERISRETRAAGNAAFGIGL